MNVRVCHRHTSSLSIVAQYFLNGETLNQEKNLADPLISSWLLFTRYTVGCFMAEEREGEKIEKEIGRIKMVDGRWISPTAIANKPRNVIKSQILCTQVYWVRVYVCFPYQYNRNGIGWPRNKYLIRYIEERI